MYIIQQYYNDATPHMGCATADRRTPKFDIPAVSGGEGATTIKKLLL